MRGFRRYLWVPLVVVSLVGAAGAVTILTQRVSVSSAGLQGDDHSQWPAISGTGRYVAFRSDATNLVTGDTNGVPDIFVFDRATNTTTRASVRGKNTQLGGVVGYENISSGLPPCISADGNRVLFGSRAADAAPGDNNGTDYDVFLRDRSTQTTSRVSRSGSGAGGNEVSGTQGFDLSADGRVAAFSSYANNLTADDANGTWDVFAVPAGGGAPTRVSRGYTGTADSGGGIRPALSGDGRFVAFTSSYEILQGVVVAAPQIWVRDLTTGRAFLVSSTVDGTPANGYCGIPPEEGNRGCALSADGRYVAFISEASNLVAGDTNGLMDVFVKDRFTGAVSRVSQSSAGAEGNARSGSCAISADGRYVAFHSGADNLDPSSGYSSGTYVHDRLTGQTRRLAANGYNPAVSWSGALLAFDSGYLFDAGDTNDRNDVFVQNGSAVGFSLLKTIVPGSGATNVSRATAVTVTFSKLVQQASAESKFVLRSNGGATVAGTFSWRTARRVMVFTPAAALAANTMYVVRLTGGIKRADGVVHKLTEQSLFVTGSAGGSAPSLAVTAAATAARGGGASVTVCLTSAATVGARVLNLAGREVAVVPAEDLAAGTHTLLWPGRSATGARVPPGRYLLQVWAQRADGVRCGALAPVSF